MTLVEEKQTNPRGVGRNSYKSLSTSTGMFLEQGKHTSNVNPFRIMANDETPIPVDVIGLSTVKKKCAQTVSAKTNRRRPADFGLTVFSFYF